MCDLREPEVSEQVVINCRSCGQVPPKENRLVKRRGRPSSRREEELVWLWFSFSRGEILADVLAAEKELI